MKQNKVIHILLFLLFGLFISTGCKRDYKISETGREAFIEPDYSGVTIPPNIAPMNFQINEAGRSYRIIATGKSGYTLSLRSSDGIVRFPERSWKKLVKESEGGKIEITISSENKDKTFSKFSPFFLNVTMEPMDPYICYRLLYPGYETYSQIKIVQRNIESFGEKSVIENQLIKNNCVNCHSFNRNNPEKFLVHIRGTVGGTYFINGGKITRTDLKTKEMTSGAVYPAWHPSGKYVTFSSNSIVQSFHSIPEKNIEVIDFASSLVIYNIEKNEISPIEESDTVKYLETFPEWSPDGKYLYYCRANQIIDSTDFKSIKYNLLRKPFFEETMTFGKAEIVFNASAISKSVSFPRVSPDGIYLVFTLHDYGNFSIWHKEADLYLLDLRNNKTEKMSLNSNETESYHSWSSNGRWLVFSSKRGDGLTARPYFAYFGSPDQIGKPFVLPQKDPTLYKRLVKTFNKPEFVTGKINFGPRDFERASKEKSVTAVWGGKKN
jgi:WD40 repeat protein